MVSSVNLPNGSPHNACTTILYLHVVIVILPLQLQSVSTDTAPMIGHTIDGGNREWNENVMVIDNPLYVNRLTVALEILRITDEPVIVRQLTYGTVLLFFCLSAVINLSRTMQRGHRRSPLNYHHKL